MFEKKMDITSQEKIAPIRSGSTADVIVAGAGVIGASIALELVHRGARVRLLDRGPSPGQASVAAAGMLAAADPHNPPELAELARASVQLYPNWLAQLHAITGRVVPFQTQTTLQWLDDGTPIRLPERSIDPRQLMAALQSALQLAISAGHLALEPSAPPWKAESGPVGVSLLFADGHRISADWLVHSAGAWSAMHNVRPRKGQMLRLRPPIGQMPEEVLRSPAGYIVPRTAGPQAGTVLVGATLEDVGFDLSLQPKALQGLRAMAERLIPGLGGAEPVESWAGLRPGTADDLPLLGTLQSRPREIIATGHFRNGILLAPVTAQLVADLVAARPWTLDLRAMRPERFIDTPTAPHRISDNRAIADDNPFSAVR